MKHSRPFPLRFLIKGALWRVKFKKKLKDDGESCQGLTDTASRLILIDADIKGPHLEWVFWHEYCHGLLHESGVTGNTGGISALAEEIICDNYADSMMRDKKVKWKRIRKNV